MPCIPCYTLLLQAHVSGCAHACVCVYERERKGWGDVMWYVIHSFHLTLWQWNYTTSVLCRRLGFKFNDFNFSGIVLQQGASLRFYSIVNKKKVTFFL